MAYTKERLDRAMELFLHKPSPQRKINKYLDEFGGPKSYSLRKRNLAGNQLSSTWIDQDDTSDYDPNEKRVVKRKRRIIDDSGASRPAKRVVKQQGRVLLKLSFPSDVGKAFLGTLPQGEQGSRYENDEEEEQWKTGNWEVPEILEGELGTKYALRKRERHRYGDSGPLTGLPTARSILSLDLGDPAARGCRPCWEFSHECPLLEEPLKYPCQVCKEDGIDCELIKQPPWKRPCENCKSRKKVCSYSYGDTDHSLACNRCQVLGISCSAGPARYKPETGKPDAGTETNEDIVPALPLTKSAKSNETIQPLPAPPSESSSAKQQKKEFGTVRKIQTSFAHPMNFAYEPRGGEPCHWCNSFAYGFMGLGRRTVEVIDYGDGKHIEMGGGHSSEGHPPSRMCVPCALERIHMMQCAGHKTAPLKGYNEKEFDFNAAYRTLTLSKPTNPWCSLCPNPAFHGCSTIQTRDKYLQPVDASSLDAKGCGLLLCSECAELVNESRGNLEVVIEKNQRNGELGSRADVEYLLPGNDLYRLYCS